MEYLSTICTDIGIRKKVNQDAALVLQAETDKGRMLFAVVCDGMGGLDKGELASSTVIKAFYKWFFSFFLLSATFRQRKLPKEICRRSPLRILLLNVYLGILTYERQKVKILSL